MPPQVKKTKVASKRVRLEGPFLLKRRVQARYDAAQTTADNRKHWTNADSLSPGQAATPEVRRVLRERGRYEVANNSYARGIVETLANYVVGTGPRLQMLTKDKALNARIETAWQEFAAAIRLAAKLRLMRKARAQDGEAFALLVNTDAAVLGVRLGLSLVEADQFSSPFSGPYSQSLSDGIKYDGDGNPKTYSLLGEYPGVGFEGLQSTTIPARNVIHWFRHDRPGQLRGLPDIMPALPLFAMLRRYTLAVIAAAESAADVAIFMKTTLPAAGVAASVPPMTEMEFEQRMAVFAPEGWEATQIKAEQPATTYQMFKQEILNEIARCLNMPYNIAACNSSNDSFASGRLDHQVFYQSIGIERKDCEEVVLDPLFRAWVEEARPALFVELSVSELAHQWFWGAPAHIDPVKDANASDIKLGDGMTNYAIEYAKEGRDSEVELGQGAKELGITLKEYQALLIQKRFGPKPVAPVEKPAGEPDAAPEDKPEGESDDAESKPE